MRLERDFETSWALLLDISTLTYVPAEQIWPWRCSLPSLCYYFSFHTFKIDHKFGARKMFEMVGNLFRESIERKWLHKNYYRSYLFLEFLEIEKKCRKVMMFPFIANKIWREIFYIFTLKFKRNKTILFANVFREKYYNSVLQNKKDFRAHLFHSWLSFL